MSKEIKFINTIKRYGKKTVITDLNLTIRENELFTMLGPSGCGKTTTLRMVAGFNSVEGGDILVGDRSIIDIPPSKRNIGMVFQNYAVFPHMTVKDNVAFGLVERKMKKAEIEKRVDEILELVKLTEYKDTLPQNMSGGQQQRIALARAIVINPDILLFDEPLSNLDAKLRVEMRDVIKEIQHNVGITAIYVTHDQEEAMAISDRIGILNQGVLQHVGTPKNIYHRPANSFVAGFIGKTNFLNATLTTEDGKRYVVFNNGYKVEMNDLVEGTEDQEVLVAVRPEEFVISKTEDGMLSNVDDNTFLGQLTQYSVSLEDGTRVQFQEESSLNSNILRNQKIRLQVKAEKINVFTKDGSRNLVSGVINDAC